MIKIYPFSVQSSNHYLLDNGEYKLLIDCGFPASLNETGRQIRNFGISLKEIDFLIHTHFHIDHAGATQDYKNIGIKCILLDNQVQALEKMEEFCHQKWPYKKLEKSDNLLFNLKNAEEFLSKKGFYFKIVSTPSHSEDSVCYVLDDGRVFSGDLMYFNLIMDENSDVKKDWNAIIDAGGKTIYPGHGSVYQLNTNTL